MLWQNNLQKFDKRTVLADKRYISYIYLWFSAVSHTFVLHQKTQVMTKLPPGSVIEWNFERSPNRFLQLLSILVPALLIVWVTIGSKPLPEVQQTASLALVPEDIAAERPTYAAFPAGTPQQAQAYIKRFQETAILEYRKYGIPASVKLAQGILESRYGTSELTKVSNNHFGVKCVYRSCKHQNCTNKCDDSCKDYFVNYESGWRSYREHSKLLSNPNYRYAELITKCDNDYKCWTKGLQKKGYATSKSYETKLNAIIKRYNLSLLDDGLTFR